jgi:hypothetical protein
LNAGFDSSTSLENVLSTYTKWEKIGISTKINKCRF